MRKFDADLLTLPPFDKLTLQQHQYLERMWTEYAPVDFVAARMNESVVFVRTYFALRDLIVYAKTGSFRKGQWE